MKKLLSLLFFIAVSTVMFAQTADTSVVTAANALYQPKSEKSGVMISANAPKALFQKMDNKMKAENAAQNQQIVLKASQAALNTEIIDRVNADNALIGALDTKASQADLTITNNNIKYVDSIRAKQDSILDANKINKSDVGLIYASSNNMLLRGKTEITNVTGTQNSVFGVVAGANLLTGSYNTLFGVAAGRYITSGSYNVAIGKNALLSTTTGSNIAVGAYALERNIDGGGNIGIGNNSGNKILGTNNTVLGMNGLNNLIVGDNNLSFGSLSATLLTTGSNNIVIGNSIEFDSPSTSNSLMIGTNGVKWIMGKDGKIAMPLIPFYTDDAAADADTALVSGSFYRITGSRVLYQKP